MFYINRLRVYGNITQVEIQKKVLTLEDFAIKINNLSQLNFKTDQLLEFKALLCNHLERVVANEP